MLLTRRITWIATITALLVPAHTLAQGTIVELGVDAGFEFDINDNAENTTSIAVPVRQLRVGVFVGDNFQIEPRVSFAFTEIADISATELGLQLAFVYNSGDPDRTRFFVLAGGGFDLIDIESESDTQWGVGGGIGVKIPVGSRFAMRIEGDYIRAFESDHFTSAHVILGLIGFSFFTN